MKYLKQSTAAVIPFGPALLPSDGVTLVTSLVTALDHASTGIFLIKNGSAGAVRHATVTATTYDSYGNYLVTLDATDTNTLGRLRVMYAAAATTAPIWEDFTVLSANIYDSLIAGTDLFDVSATQLAGQAITAAAGVTFPTSVASPTNITAATGITVSTNSDKTGYSLSSAYDPAKTAAQAGDAMALTSGERTTLAASIWNALTSGLTTVASIGKLLVDNINATISSRSTYAGADTSGTTTLLSRLSSTRAGLLDNLDAAVSGVAAAVWAVTSRTLSAFGFTVTLTSAYDASKTAAQVADIPTAVQNRAEMDSNSTKLANLDAAVSTRSTYAGGAVASVTAPVALTSAYDAAKTAAQPSDVPTTSEITEAILKRKIVWNTGTGQFDVYDAAGSTVAFSLQPTTDPTADPIVGIEEA